MRAFSCCRCGSVAPRAVLLLLGIRAELGYELGEGIGEKADVSRRLYASVPIGRVGHDFVVPEEHSTAVRSGNPEADGISEGIIHDPDQFMRYPQFIDLEGLP